MALPIIVFLVLQACRPETKPYVVMLSVDGFRWDYPDKFNTPNLDRIEKKGVKAHSLQPCFPSKTFPNHYSIATGLYPDHHGIVANSFYDPEFPFSQRLDSVIAWLQLPEDRRPQLVTWYMDEPDSRSHDTGPDNPELGLTITYLDSLAGVFLDKLEALPIASQVNVIVTSDHGMGETCSERWINLSDYVRRDWFEESGGSNPSYNLLAHSEYYDSAWLALKDIPNVQAWKRNTVPERFHYGTNPRVTDFIVLADSSWTLSWLPAPPSFTGGSHGYDNRNTDMHAIFYAFGPAFRKGFSQPTFENIHIYPLICEILGLKPAKTDGNLKKVADMLKERNLK